jgi:hypothetical protein
VYDSATYSALKEWSGQCISVARIHLSSLDNPAGKAKRWNGKTFNEPYNGIGTPIQSLQINISEGGGPASNPASA